MSITDVLKRESPLIATVIGVIGFGIAMYEVSRVNPEARRKLAEAHFEDKERETEHPFVNFAKDIRTAAPLYTKAVGLTLLSTGLVVGSQLHSRRQRLRLSSAINLMSEGLRRWETAAIDTLKPKDYEAVKIASATPPHPPHPGWEPTQGMVDMYDAFSGRYFKVSRVEQIYEVTNLMNETLRDSMTVDVNYYFDLVGLDETQYNFLGWDIENGSIEIRLDSDFVKGTKHPCVVVSFVTPPAYIL